MSQVLSEFLDVINLDDFVALVVLIGLLIAIGDRMARSTTATYCWARRLSAATLSCYAAIGIYVWGIASASEMIAILIRAILAAGIAFGIVSIMFPVLHVVFGSTTTMAMNKILTWRTSSERDRRDAEDRRRREREEHLRSSQAEQERHRISLETARADQERKTSVEDARAEVIRFYDEHGELLADSLPPALFRSQLQTRFHEGIKSGKAWETTQETISSMLPLIANGRERQRAENDNEQKRKAQALEDERKQVEIAERRNSIERLTAWYQREKAGIEQSLPENLDRDNILNELFDRYDQLLKQTLREMKP